MLVGAYEMKQHLEVPYKVVIDEAIQLNTHFGSSDGYKMIHVVMDKIAKDARMPEVEADAKKAKTEDAPPSQAATEEEK